ncbi:hypothetical protein [Streptomyces collinus]|uniref:hypothetical protein n=1 Tax=Streptomyces collinus TaxID=42684 RepID=UPI003689C127
MGAGFSRFIYLIEDACDWLWRRPGVAAVAAPGEHLAVLAAHSTGGLLVLNLSGITFSDYPGLYTLLGIRRMLPYGDINVQFTRASTVLRARF